jgi:signal transduction histidine kinase/CheY-like chemotaxis protein
VTRVGLAVVLAERRDRIVDRFAHEVERQQLPPPGLPASLLLDHIPQFLEEVLGELRRVDTVGWSQDARDTSEIAARHGQQRWELGYDLEAVIREYGILRHSVLQTAKEAGADLTIDEVDVFSKCLMVGIASAASEYVKYRDRQLQVQKDRLDFLAQSGQLLSSSLDYRSTLSSLTGLLVPRLADWCAVHLEGTSVDDMVIAHVEPGKVALLREIYRRFPVPADANHGYPWVLRTGEAQLMPEVQAAFLEQAARDADHLSLLRRIATCSWMVVPLRLQDVMFGALTFAYSDSGRHYDASDLAFATDLAGRAALAIHNARLFDLSQQARSRVEAATRAKDEFVAAVSHELRAPLNAIVGWLHLLRSGSLAGARRDHALEVIHRNAEAQSRLVADLLDISQVITGKIRMQMSQVDLGKVVDLAIESARPAADAKRIEIAEHIEREDVVARADPDRLHQVVWNLLGNAVKFTPKGGKVTVRLCRADSDLEFVVEDTGAGIEPGFLPHVFEAFRQYDGSTTRQYGGLGIGLSIVKHIVELHGGSIVAHSGGLGQGSSFVVRLPISPLAVTKSGDQRVAVTAPNPVSPPSSELQGVRVLVVDDDADARELVALVVEACGMEVRLAAGVVEALAMLTTYPAQLVIADIGLPDESGYSLVRSIRTHVDERKRDLPMIALTAYAGSEDRTRALVEGFNVHLAKPVEPDVLVDAALGLVRQRVGR